jgi:hypothetical protein
MIKSILLNRKETDAYDDGDESVMQQAREIALTLIQQGAKTVEIYSYDGICLDAISA